MGRIQCSAKEITPSFCLPDVKRPVVLVRVLVRASTSRTHYLNLAIRTVKKNSWLFTRICFPVRKKRCAFHTAVRRFRGDKGEIKARKRSLGCRTKNQKRWETGTMTVAAGRLGRANSHELCSGGVAHLASQCRASLLITERDTGSGKAQGAQHRCNGTYNQMLLPLCLHPAELPMPCPSTPQ